MIYREATTNDIEQMHRVRMAVKENVLSNPALVTHQDYVNYLTTIGKGWLCESGGEVLGFAIVGTEEKNVWALFVSPEAEGKGIGKTLHNTLLDWYFSHHTEPLWLTTSPGTRAEEFYRRCGWTEVGRQANGEVKFEKRGKAEGKRGKAEERN
ncbi:MAG TPA: GNAT family N-acetyltransferase [Flavisolibacter sp.]|jgi:GNAT superfamily N-acetyltransferase